jgi:hypothetical protein
MLTLLTLFVVFMCATLIGYVAIQTWLPDEVDRRMARLAAPQQSAKLSWDQKSQPAIKALLAWLRPLATLATETEEAGPWPLRVRFLNAGFLILIFFPRTSFFPLSFSQTIGHCVVWLV